MRIVPALLTDKASELQSMLRLAESFTTWAQIDIMDGLFVPSRSITSADIVPIPTSLRWEAHLMVREPEEYLAGFKEAGAERVVFHYEASERRHQTISLARSLGLAVGMALNPGTPWQALRPFLAELDCVLFSTVHPGFYGSKFLPEVLDGVREFKRQVPGMETGVDGGIKPDNIVQVAQTGVENLCVGSAIFNRPDPKESYLLLQDLVANLK